jgi:hypothetical protein
MAGVLAARADPAGADKTTVNSSGWDLPDFIDRLPDFLAERLPGFDPEGSARFYVRPHFGDFLHRSYVRVPVGTRIKATERLETNAELQTYFTDGLHQSEGYGLSGLLLGARCEHVLPSLGDGGLSVGANMQTPLSRPPIDLSDGYRHFLPYVAATYPFAGSWHVLGYANIGGDFLNHTALPSNFGRNQLHSDSLSFSAGAAREWGRFHVSLTATVVTSALTSDEAKQVYALRPEIVVPWQYRPTSRTKVFFTLGGRAIHGPDGNEFGVSGSARLEFLFRPSKSTKQ